MDKSVTNVTRFIARFTNNGEHAEVVECFRYGCCYWFAKILKQRFGGLIMYDVVANHFACKIGDRIFDITGDVTDKGNWENWGAYVFTDRTHYWRIVKECIKF